MCSDCKADLSVQIHHFAWCPYFEDLSADEGRFAWEYFTFASDDQREEFFAAVSEGRYEDADRICDEADKRQFESVH